MNELEKKTILENVKRVEKEELEKIQKRLREWQESQRKESTKFELSNTASTSSRSSKRAKPEENKSEDKDIDKKKKRTSAGTESTKSKSEKSSKKGKTGSVLASTASPKQDMKSAETINPKWQEAAVALEGSSSRKSKFMRLMGAGKVEVPPPSIAAKSAGKLKEELKKREKELGKQFEHGLAMKNETGAKRRGLGA